LTHFEKCGELQTAGSSEDDLTSVPPFRGWIVSGERWESFTIDGQLKLDLTDSSFDEDTFHMPTVVLSPRAGATPAPDGKQAKNEPIDTSAQPEASMHDTEKAGSGWSCRVG
jgi:hypothetical protein